MQTGDSRKGHERVLKQMADMLPSSAPIISEAVPLPFLVVQLSRDSRRKWCKIISCALETKRIVNARKMESITEK